MKNQDVRSEFNAWIELYFIGKKSRGFRNTNLLADLLASEAPFFMTPQIKRELIEILRDYSKLRDTVEGKKESQSVDEGWMFWLHYKNQRDGLNGRQSKDQIAAYLGCTFDRVDKTIQRKFPKAKQEKEKEWADLYLSLRDKS